MFSPLESLKFKQGILYLNHYVKMSIYDCFTPNGLNQLYSQAHVKWHAHCCLVVVATRLRMFLMCTEWTKIILTRYST